MALPLIHVIGSFSLQFRGSLISHFWFLKLHHSYISSFLMTMDICSNSNTFAAGFRIMLHCLPGSLVSLPQSDPRLQKQLQSSGELMQILGTFRRVLLLRSNWRQGHFAVYKFTCMHYTYIHLGSFCHIGSGWADVHSDQIKSKLGN